MPTPLSEVEVFVEAIDKPEGIAIGNDDVVYVSSSDGWIYAVTPSGQSRKLAKIGERPLGIAIDRQGDLYVCEMGAGVVHHVTQSGRVSAFADQVAERRLQTPNFAVSDSGSADLDNPRDDGAIYRISPSGCGIVVAEGLYFANGLALGTATKEAWRKGSSE